MNEEKQNNNKQDTLKWLIIGIIAFAIILLAFGLGKSVGEMRARFSYRWAENYQKNFAGPQEGFLNNFQPIPAPGEFIEGHGTFGQIIKIEIPKDSEKPAFLIIKGLREAEKIILVNSETIIERFRETLKLSDLKVNDFIVVIGEPTDSGQIIAKLIRLFPSTSKNDANQIFNIRLF